MIDNKYIKNVFTSGIFAISIYSYSVGCNFNIKLSIKKDFPLPCLPQIIYIPVLCSMFCTVSANCFFLSIPNNSHSFFKLIFGAGFNDNFLG